MTNAQKVKIDGHYEDLLKLQQQRENGEFCDVTLQAETKEFPVHKNVLSAASDYFHKMFTTDMKEKNSTDILIENVTATAMEEVLNCMYTGQLELSEETLNEILNAAALMQLTSTLEQCDKFMRKTLAASNCCLYLRLAEAYSFDQLVEIINKFFLDEFDAVCKEPEFLKLGVKKIEEIISSESLNIKRESTVFEFVVEWVKQDLDERKKDFLQLFKHVRLQFISIKYVVQIVRVQDFVRECHECRDLVDNAFAHYVSPNVLNAQKHRKCFAPKTDSIFLIPFQQRYQALYDYETKSWKKLIFEGFSDQTVPKDCAMANQFPITILCGGVKNINQVTSQVLRFDNTRWMNMPRLKKARCGAAAVFHKGGIFVFGGETFPISSTAKFSSGQVNPDAENFANTYEKFVTEWESFQFSDIKRSFFAAQSVFGTIYLIGGYTLTSNDIAAEHPVACKEVCNETIAFCPESDTWKKCGQLNEARAYFACEKLGGLIFVLGGIGIGGSNLTSMETLPMQQPEVWTVYKGFPARGYPYGAKTDSGILTSCLVNLEIFVAESRYRLLHCKNIFDKVSWSEDSQAPPAAGKLISFSKWFLEEQTFAEIRKLS